MISHLYRCSCYHHSEARPESYSPRITMTEAVLFRTCSVFSGHAIVDRFKCPTFDVDEAKESIKDREQI